MFTSDAGMFSPGHVDEASSLLLHTMPKRTGRFLDLGCGYGVIGIVMGKVYGLEVTMADSNGRALRCAQQNCEANQVKAQIIRMVALLATKHMLPSTETLSPVLMQMKAMT